MVLAGEQRNLVGTTRKFYPENKATVESTKFFFEKTKIWDPKKLFLTKKQPNFLLAEPKDFLSIVFQ